MKECFDKYYGSSKIYLFPNLKFSAFFKRDVYKRQDPDLVPIEISDEWMDKVRDAQPEFRDEKKVRYKEEYDLPDYDIDIITGSKHLADIFEATIALGSEPKEVSNWLMGETIRLVNESEMDIDDVSFKPEHLAKLIEMIKNNEINRSVGKEVFEKVFKEDIDPAAYVEEHGLKSCLLYTSRCV